MGIKKVVQAWNSVSLVKRIVIGLVIGGVLGVAVPNIEVVELLGTLFVSALKGVAPILVFFLVISALANARAAGSNENRRAPVRGEHVRRGARGRWWPASCSPSSSR